jgi:metallophosphoesterase superfamily enzyme
LKIHELRKQVQKYGGDIEVIVGNHDDFMISFLTGRNGVH